MTQEEKLKVANKLLDELRGKMDFGALKGVEFVSVLNRQDTLMCATMRVASGAVLGSDEFIGQEDAKGIRDLAKFRLGIAAQDIKLMAEDLLEALEGLG